LSRKHRGADALRERLEENGRSGHGLAKGGLRSEALEREFPEAEVLDGAEDRFVAAPKHGVDADSAPGHLERREPKRFLAG